MLGINDKKTRENIRKYIVENFNPDGYNFEKTPETWHEISMAIMDTFKEEKKYDRSSPMYRVLFVSWCQGLPSILNCCYYYNRSAVEDVKKILEYQEGDKFYRNKSECESLITELMWCEICKGCRMYKEERVCGY